MSALFIVLTVLIVQGNTEDIDFYEYDQVNYERWDNFYPLIHTLNVQEFFDTLEACDLVYPNGQSYELYPEDKSPHPNVSFVGPGPLFTPCGVTLTPVLKEFEGIWQLTSVNRRSSNNDQFYASTQKFNLTVIDRPWKEDKIVPMKSVPGTNTETLNAKVFNDEIGSRREVKIEPKSLLDRLKRCFVVTPKGNTIELFPNEDKSMSNVRFSNKGITQAKCGVVLDPIDEESRGEWHLVWESDHTTIQPFVEVLPDLLDDVKDDNVIVHTAATGGSITIDLDRTLNQMSKDLECFVQDPRGDVFEIYPNTNTTHAINPLNQSSNYHECGVVIEPIGIEHTGTWYIFRKKASIVDMEKNFFIAIEDHVKLIPDGEVKVFRGTDLYIRFPAELKDEGYRCKVVPPENSTYFNDLNYPDQCGIVLNNITDAEAGLWTIYTNPKYLYKQIGEVIVKLNDDAPQDPEPIYANIGQELYLDFGPEDALFCYIIEPSGKTVERKHAGQCSHHIPAVDYMTFGSWKAEVGLAGSINTFSYSNLILPIEVAENKISVSTECTQQTTKLKCTLESEDPLKVCRFINPEGDVLVVDVGLGNSIYRSIGKPSTQVENGYFLECGIEILNPTESDYGSWQCILDMEKTTKNAFLQLSVTDHIEVQSRPTTSLTAVDQARQVVTGKPFDLKCEAQQSLTYCWFLSPNGTIFTPIAGSHSANFGYYGEGLSYGHCGITVFAASSTDNGNWTCNAKSNGNFDASNYFSVDVRATPLLAQDQVLLLTNEMRLTCATINEQPLDYCRFVRPDGVGINLPSESLSNPVSQYSDGGTNSSIGFCQLRIRPTTSSDIGRWRCFGKPRDLAEEYHDIIDVIVIPTYYKGTGKIILWTTFASLIVSITCIVMLLSLQKRRTLFQRTTNSSVDFNQNSKLPLPTYHNNTNHQEL